MMPVTSAKTQLLAKMVSRMTTGMATAAVKTRPHWKWEGFGATVLGDLGDPGDSGTLRTLTYPLPEGEGIS
jgi:hypothetical protein